MSYSVTQEDFVAAFELAAQNGLTKPAELLAVVAAVSGVHPDHLPMIKSATDRVRAAYRRILDGPLAAPLMALRRPADPEVASAPGERIPEPPEALLEAYVAAGVSEETVRMLWVRHPYWLKLSVRVFGLLVSRGMIDNPDGFLVQTCRRKWFLHPNYDKAHTAQQHTATKDRKQDETAMQELKQREAQVALKTASSTHMDRIRAQLANIGVNLS